MDFTTLLIGALIALGIVGTDAAIKSGSVFVEVNNPPWTENMDVDKVAVESQIENLLSDIADTHSVVNPPEITFSRYHGVGMAVAESLGMGKVAFAAETQFGFAPEQLRIEFYEDHGALRALVTGYGKRIETLGEVLTLEKDEPVMAFVRRCTLLAASHIAPYATAINLLEEHAIDKDFKDVVALVEREKAELPPTPTSFQRSLYDNLLGLVALFKNDPNAAEAAFAAATADDPSNPVPFINAGFVDLQQNKYQQAADRMEQLIRLAPPENNVLLASAYMTWGAALLGLHQLDNADRLIAMAAQKAPTNSTAYGLWADARRLMGDNASADALYRRALENTAVFENYAEVAVLYFKLAWEDNKPVQTSKFTPRDAVNLH
jgi:tetratricopeptide (TPR) repeat protein